MKKLTGHTICLLLVIASLLGACSEEKKERVLPFIGHYDVEYKTVDGKEVTDTVYPRIPAFKFLNQDSVWVSSKDMKGKIWVADFFFTSCPTICPKMTSQMKRLSVLTKDLEKEIQFMSFSINPDNDKPHVLKRYIAHYGIQAKNWQFFTGKSEAEVHLLGDENFLVNAREDLGSEGGYAHSEAFVLVDKEGYIRGMYNGTDTKEVDKLHTDLRKLLKYEYELDIRE
ncbi:MAG: electron transport protein SCO1/SenC [Crocinitomicaceae bacterium]|jgi:protein SCO1/2|nr:electron transport protein SCO1/SenC [Crocinitomicaceae bacterium]